MQRHLKQFPLMSVIPEFHIVKNLNVVDISNLHNNF